MNMHNELVRRLRDYHLLGIHDWDVYLAAADLIEQQAEELRSAKIMCDSYVAENQRFFDEANALHRDNAALMADGAEQARLAREAQENAHGLSKVIAKLSGELASLRAQIEGYQSLCAAAYQLAGTMNAPVRFLDALSDGANGELEARAKTDNLLPVSPDEVGTFLSDEGEGFRKDSERLDWMIEWQVWIQWTVRDGSIRQCQVYDQDEDENYLVLSGDDRYFNTPREAIDAAMAQKEG